MFSFFALLFDINRFNIFYVHVHANFFSVENFIYEWRKGIFCSFQREKLICTCYFVIPFYGCKVIAVHNKANLMQFIRLTANGASEIMHQDVNETCSFLMLVKWDFK